MTFEDSASVIAALLAAGADPSLANSKNWTVWHYVTCGEVPVASVTALAVDGRGISKETKEQHTPLDSAPEVFAALAKAGADFEGKDPGTMRALVDIGADTEAPVGDGATALHIAIEYNTFGFTRALLEAGTEIDAQDDWERTARFYASRKAEAPERVTALLELGADPRLVDKDGTTALHAAAVLGSARSVDALIAAGADPNVRGAKNLAPIHAAALFAETRVTVPHLVAGGADPDTTLEGDLTPLLAVIASRPRPEFIAALIEAGGDLEARESTLGFTPLLLAAARSGARILEMLLDASAKLLGRAHTGQTAWILANENPVLADHPVLDRLRTARI